MCFQLHLPFGKPRNLFADAVQKFSGVEHLPLGLGNLLGDYRLFLAGIGNLCFQAGSLGSYFASFLGKRTLLTLTALKLISADTARFNNSVTLDDDCPAGFLLCLSFIHQLHELGLCPLRVAALFVDQFLGLFQNLLLGFDLHRQIGAVNLHRLGFFILVVVRVLMFENL